MRNSRAIFALVFAVLSVAQAVTAIAEEIKPYTAMVISETADVLSGPGKNHYPTDRLAKGARIMVYRHDPGGYLAIRPPQGSFSLVLASDVQSTTDSKVVEVVGPTAKAWVGSRLPGQVKPMWQLKLKVGELLNVIRRVEIDSAISGQPEIWIQVEPPAGEFRWLHKDHVGQPAPATVSASEIRSAKLQQAKDELDNVQRAEESARNVNSVRSSWNQVSGGKPRPVRKLTFAEGASFQQKLGTIDLALSQEVLLPASQWQLNSLSEELANVRASAKTGEELAQADRIAAKVIGFQKVLAQTDPRIDPTAVSNPSTGVAARLGTPNLVNGMNRAAGSATANNVAKYDGQGILRKLVVNGGRAPAVYALENSQGKIIKTITPSAGVNLERYIGQPVGLFGRNGYNHQLKQPHLTAARVVDLNRIR